MIFNIVKSGNFARIEPIGSRNARKTIYNINLRSIREIT